MIENYQNQLKITASKFQNRQQLLELQRKINIKVKFRRILMGKLYKSFTKPKVKKINVRYSLAAEAYLSVTSNDYSTHRRNTDNSIINLRLKESPNYQSIMDLWSETMVRQQNYCTRSAEDEDMGNTDENITISDK